MSRPELKWESYVAAIPEQRIADVQNNLEVRFPETFLDCVRKCNGGRPEPHCFSYYHTEWKESDEGGFGVLLDFREPMDIYLKNIHRNDPDLWRDMDIQPWWTIEDTNLLERVDHFTPGLIAFAEDGGGNYICFDYRDGKHNPNPPIVFWHHEFHSGGEEPFFVAKDFDSFLNMLRPSRDELPEISRTP